MSNRDLVRCTRCWSIGPDRGEDTSRWYEWDVDLAPRKPGSGPRFRHACRDLTPAQGTFPAKPLTASLDTQDAVRLMGSRVLVFATMKRVFLANNVRTWEPRPLEIARAGWFVGIRWLNIGVYDAGTPPSRSGFFGMDDCDPEPPSLRITERIQAVQVAWWPTQKLVHVPVVGFELILGVDNSGDNG